MKCRYAVPIVFAAVFALAGCAATVKQTQTPTEPALASNTNAPTTATPADSATAIAVMLVPKEPLQQDDDWRYFVEEWQSAIPGAAEELKVSAALVASDAAIPPAATTLVRINVNSFRYVSTVKRYMIGVFSGNAAMNIDVEYLRLPSMQSLGSKNISTSSRVIEGIFSAVTPAQVRAVSRVLLRDAMAGGVTK